MHNSIIIEMTQQENINPIPQYTTERLSHKMFININSNTTSNSTSKRDLIDSQSRPKIYHALSSRRLHNTSQFTLSQLIQTADHDRPRGDKRTKRTSDNQLQDGSRKQRSSHPRLRIQEAKQTNKTLSTLLEGTSKEELVRIRCKQCEEVFKSKQRELQRLEKEINVWQGKYHKLQEKHEQLKKKFQPYVNNLNLLSVVVDSIQEKERQIFFGQSSYAEAPQIPTCDSNELQETAKVNRWLLKEGREKDKFYHSQTFRLNCQIDTTRGENSKLRGYIQAKDSKIRGLEEQLRYYQSNSSMRQRLQMCRQELYTYKMKYQQRAIEAEAIGKKLQETRYKLTILTSLIGCAIIFDLKQKDNYKASLKEFINKIDKYQTITHNILENNGFQYFKFYDATRKENRKERVDSKDKTNNRTSKNENPPIVTKTVQYRKLYFPNYLVLLGEQSIAARAEHVIIKPLLFIKIRAILDSKYIDYRLFEGNATQFPQFCSSYLKIYDILKAEKKPYLLIRQITQNETKEMSIEFFKCLLDERIQDLPQVQIFREFLLGRWEQDEIYFYLMCRHKFLQGSELQNFINSGDPSKFVRFDKAKRILLRLTDNFGRNIQNFICHHLNQRRINKAGQEFVRLYYLLKVLLLIYRKIRIKKIDEFRQCFESVLAVTRRSTLTFLQFCQLLKKNFEFLPRSDACSMYRKIYALFESQKNQPNFYECFVAACLPQLFLQELIRQDKQLELDCMTAQQILTYTADPKIEKRGSISPRPSDPRLSSQMRLSAAGSFLSHRNTHSAFKTAPKVNPLNQLWPDSVYILGNEVLNRQYVELIKNSSWEQPRVKLEILDLLSSLAQGHLIKQNIFMREKQSLSLLLSDAIFNLIQFLNRVQKQKIEYENEINLASRKIGRFFKNKIYQFYQQMLEDVNSVKAKPATSEPHKKDGKNKRYFKEKIRASKVFGTFKLN